MSVHEYIYICIYILFFFTRQMKKQQQQNNVRINKWMESERVGVMERGGKRMYGEVNEAR